MSFRQIKLLQKIADAQACGVAVKDLQHRHLQAYKVLAQQLGMKIDTKVGKNDLEPGIEKKQVCPDHDTATAAIQALDDKVATSRLPLKGDKCWNDQDNESGVSGASQQTTHVAPRDESNEVVDISMSTHEQAGENLVHAPIDDQSHIPEDLFSVLNNLMAKMMAFEELDPLLQHVVEVMVELTTANTAMILLVDETREFMQVVASAGSSERNNIGARWFRGKGLAGLAWATASTQYTLNSDDSPLSKEYWPSRSQLIAVPMLNTEEVIGVVVLGASNSCNTFSSTIGLVNNLAGLASIAIASARAFERARAEVRQNRALSDISKRMTDIDDVGDIFDFVSKTLMDAMNITHSNSYLVNQRGQIVSYASWERSAQNVVKAESLTNELVAESAAQWCYENGEPVHIPRNHEDKRESSRIHAIRREKGIGSSLCWPVIVSGQTIGVITINRERSQRDFNENEINLFTSVVNQLSSALHGHNLSKALQHQVNHDSLTQLPNRRFFESELNKQLDNQVQAGTLGAIMFLDLDGFKSVNDSIGHSSGDKLLKHVAMRLQNRIPENDILARIGGDEFAVICKDLSNQQDAIIIAERLAASLCMPFQIGKESVNIGTSIGLSFFPLDGLSANELLHNADQAMYKAKSQGKNCVVRYEHSMGKELRERSQLEVEIRHAIDNDELQLYFQPQVNVDEGIVTGVEALIRWQHPSGKLLAPGQFIPIAEKSDAIDHIGAWVLNRAIWQLHQWQDTPLNKLRMGVNIAATQFIHKGFADDVLTLLSQSQISPGMLELEVTESVVMRDLQAVAERLNTLRAAGVRIAVDDFGTGYSSLSYLQDLPLDVLKIDRAFVSRLENEEAERSIVNTIILLANGLKLSTIAEGVETQKQLEQISRLGCSTIQGYYFAKPCTAQELPQVIDGIERSLETPLMRKMAR